MQPARGEVVQNLTVPRSAATAGARRSARMSFPWCGPFPRGSPKSSRYCTAPMTGKTMRAGGFDVHAVEEALRIKESTGDGEVVLVTMGPESALDALRKALAMGADRVLLVADEAAAGLDLVATSLALARALEQERPDLVLFGQQSKDGDGP